MQSRFRREKTPQKVQTSTKTEEKPQKVLIVASFEGDDEKAQYASFQKHLHLMAALIITKLTIDCIYRHERKCPGEYSLTFAL